jgi:hypothetical protein
MHDMGCPSTFGASWPPFTSSLKANLVTVEQLHGSGSSTLIVYEGAMSIGGGARDEVNTRRKRKGARRSGAEARSKGRQALSVEVKDSPSFPLDL